MIVVYSSLLSRNDGTVPAYGNKRQDDARKRVIAIIVGILVVKQFRERIFGRTALARVLGLSFPAP
jgi:hypothetical protein